MSDRAATEMKFNELLQSNFVRYCPGLGESS